MVKGDDIKVGDKICGTNGTIQEVIGIFPKGKKEIYKIILKVFFDYSIPNIKQFG